MNRCERRDVRIIMYANEVWARQPRSFAGAYARLASLLAGAGEHPDLGVGRASRFAGWLWCAIAQHGVSATLHASICIDVRKLSHPLFLDSENARFQEVLLNLTLGDVQALVADMPVVYATPRRSE